MRGDRQSRMEVPPILALECHQVVPPELALGVSADVLLLPDDELLIE